MCTHRSLVASITLAVVLAVTGACTGDAAIESALDGREFVLESSRQFELVPDAEVRLSFQDGELGFSAGCNSSSGPFEVREGRLVVGRLASTRKGCEPALHDQDERLADFMSSHPDLELNDTRLTLAGTEATLAFLDREVPRADRPLTGIVWTIDAFIDGGAANQLELSTPPSLEFETDGTFAVFNGCNSGGGQYALQGARITFSDLVSSDAVCSGAAGMSESRVLAVVREGTVDFEIEAGRLTLTRGAVGLLALAP